jgi:hypothetical protein
MLQQTIETMQRYSCQIFARRFRHVGGSAAEPWQLQSLYKSSSVMTTLKLSIEYRLWIGFGR